MKKFFNMLITGVVVLAAALAVSLFLPDTGSASLESPQVQAQVTAPAAEPSDSRLYYSNLGANARQAYDMIMAEIKSHPEQIEIPELNNSELDAVFKALCYDNPDLLCLGRTCKTLTNGWSFSKKCVFIPEYSCTREECETRSRALEEAASDILASAGRFSSDYEKELFVHDYIVENCAYAGGRTQTDDFSTAYSALVSGEAVCEGYAKAAQLLLMRMGVKNYLITGNAVDKQGVSELHMWNVVYVDGKPYHLDVTWDDPTGGTPDAVSHAYFNLTDADISLDHSNFEPEQPNCLHTESNYFVKESLYFLTYNSSSAERIKNALSQSVKKGQNTCQIRFSTAAEYERAERYLIDNGEIYDILKRVKALTGADTSTDTITYSSDSALCVLELTLSEGD